MFRENALAVLAAATLLSQPLPSHAEESRWSLAVAGFAGGTITPDLETRGDDPTLGSVTSYLGQRVERTAGFGAKLQVLRGRERAVGLEVDVRYAKAQQKAQSVRIVGEADGAAFEDHIDLPRIDAPTTTATLGPVVRVGGQRVAFFAGAGAGLEHQALEFDDAEGLRVTDTSFAFRTSGGLEIALGRRVHGLVQYAFTTAKHTVTVGTEVDTTRSPSHRIEAGIVWRR